MLVLSRKPQQQIQIGDGITISILHVKGNVVRVGIEAPREVRVVRGELPRKGPRTPAGTQPTSPATSEPDIVEPSDDAHRPLAMGSESLRMRLRRRMAERSGQTFRSDLPSTREMHAIALAAGSSC